jgi:hypothetical protein
MIVIYILAGLVALLLVIAAFVKKDYEVQRNLSINRPKTDVFDFIRHLKNQDAFSVWARIDPAMKKEYSGTDGTPGFTSAWDSKNKKAGKGSQTIIKITEGERIDSMLHFIKPFEGRADAFMSTKEIAASQTNVTWSISSAMKYPMNIMLLFMNMDNIMGKDLEGGLQNLKNLMENKS